MAYSHIAYVLSLMAISLVSFSLRADSGNKEASCRIIALAPHLVEIVFNLGLGHCLVGVSEHADFPPAAKTITRVGNYAGLNFEKIIELKPNLILAWQGGNPAQALARLKTLGFSLVMSQPLKLEDVAEDLLRVGQATGRQVRAKELVSQYNKRLTALKNHYANKRPLKIFYELWPQPLTTVAEGTWPHDAVSLCRVDNVFGDSSASFPQVNLESILALKPEVILSAKGKNSYFSAWPSTQRHLVPALAHQQRIQFDEKRLHRMTPRVLDAVSELCEKIAESRRFYDTRSVSAK